MTIERFDHLLRWYPAQWRDRYGDEMTALLEDTYATAGEVPLGQRVGLAWSGLGERARSAGFVGWSQEPDARVRGGSLLVLCGWALFVVAVAVFGKVTDNWSAETPPAGRWVANAGYSVVAVAAGVGCLVVLLAAVLVLPAFVRFLRAGGWRRIWRPVVVAVASVVAAAVLLAIAVAWAHNLSAHDRSGGLPIYSAFFVVVALAFVTAVGCATFAVVSVARRIELSHPTVRALGAMALGLVVVMALVFAALLAWWVSEAVHAPAYLLQSIGNGVPFTSSAVPPTLLASGFFMTCGLVVAGWGVLRIVRSLGSGDQAAA